MAIVFQSAFPFLYREYLHTESIPRRPPQEVNLESKDRVHFFGRAGKVLDLDLSPTSRRSSSTSSAEGLLSSHHLHANQIIGREGSAALAVPCADISLDDKKMGITKSFSSPPQRHLYHQQNVGLATPQNQHRPSLQVIYHLFPFNNSSQVKVGLMLYFSRGNERYGWGRGIVWKMDHG